MKTQKLLLFLTTLLLISCSKENIDTQSSQVTPTIPSTEVFVQGGILGIESGTRGNVDSRTYNKWPYVNTAEGWETARFSIRADGQIVDVSNQSSALYFGRPAGKIGRNRGAVYTAYNYGRYNDRDLDYYQKDKKTGENIGLFRYVHDEKGIKTQLAIEDAPLVINILEDEKEDLITAISKEQNTNLNNKVTTMITKNSSNRAKLHVVDSLMALGSNYLEKHILWYVVKEVGMRNGWHVNGIISKNEVEKPIIDVSKIPNNVEIDIHQQYHKNWNEIKTSIHIRTDVESIKINLPISKDNILEKDDFDIRVYNFYYKEFVINPTISYNDESITIEISNISNSLINDLKSLYGDGLNIEIHNYYKGDIWENLKRSKVILGKDCELKGQITSAFSEESIIITK